MKDNLELKVLKLLSGIFILLILMFFVVFKLNFEGHVASAKLSFVFLQLSILLLVSFGVVLVFQRKLFKKSISRPIQNIQDSIQKMATTVSLNQLLNKSESLDELSRKLPFICSEISTRIVDLNSTKSRLEAVLLSMIEGVMVVDYQGHVLLMNRPLIELLDVKGYPVGRKPLEIIRNLEIQSLSERILKKGTGGESLELSILVPEEKIFIVHATPVIRENNIIGAVLVFHDITQLRHLENIRRDFVANVSHELRTPVATIKGYAETLLEGALDDKENARDFVEIIHTDADRLAKLINELLDLSQIESGNMNFDFIPCSLKEISDRVLKVLQKPVRDQALTVKNEISDDLSRVRADEMTLVQIFLNLIENAVKYNKHQGSIVLSAIDKGNMIEVSIADTGIGIPEEDLARVFERFYRVDKAHSRQLGGTGLGLSIVKHLVQANQGEVFVKSIIDEGTTFSFTLPKAT